MDPMPEHIKIKIVKFFLEHSVPKILNEKVEKDNKGGLNMKLFHSSNLKLSVLMPMFGEGRHKGEDPRAVNEPVVYLTNSEEDIFSEKLIPAQYKYIVEISEDDPDLFLDENDFSFRQECYEDDGELDTTRWYFLKRSINVHETLEWDGEKYVKIDNF